MKKYLVCESNIDGKGIKRIHGNYDSWWSGFWKFIKLSLGPVPIGRTRFFMQSQEVEDGSN